MPELIKDPGFLDSIGKLQQSSETATALSSELLNAIPEFQVQNATLEAKKTAIKNQAAEQSTQLFKQSNDILRQTMEAESTPFYDVVAFFTDKPSFDELDAQQNLTASRMNTLSALTNEQVNRVTAEQTALQQNLALQKETFSIAQQQLQIEAQSVSARATAAQNQEQFASNLIGRMDTGQLRDIVSGASKVPGVNITEAAKQLRIREDTERLGRQGAKAKREDVEQNFFERHTIDELLAIGEASRNQNQVINLGSGFTMSPRSFFARLQEEQTKKDATEVARAQNAIAAGQAFVDQVSTQQILARETQGVPTPESTKAFGEFSFLNAEFENAATDVERANATGNPTVQKQAMLRLITTQSALANHAEGVKQAAIKREQATLVSDASKQAAADYVGTGRFDNDLTAAVYVDEVSQIANPDSVASKEQNFILHSGISAYLKQMDLEKQKALGDTEFNKDGELDMDAVMASMFSNSRTKPKIADMTRAAIANAVIDRDGEQISIQDSIVDDASRTLLSRGIAQMAKAHESEPETIKALDSLLTNSGGFIRSDLNDRGSLLNALALRTAELRRDGKLGEEVNLATEMRLFMSNEQTYVQNSDVFNNSSPQGAAINRFIFANDMQGFLTRGLQKHWKAGANDESLVLQESARLAEADKSIKPQDQQDIARLQEELAANESLPNEQRMAPIKRIFKEEKLRNLQRGAARRAELLQTDRLANQ